MAIPKTFRPGATATLAYTTASARVALPAAPVPATVPVAGLQYRVFNDGAQNVFVAFGDNTVAADTATGFPIPANTVLYLRASIPGLNTHIAAIAPAGSGNLRVTTGEGD